MSSESDIQARIDRMIQRAKDSGSSDEIIALMMDGPNGFRETAVRDSLHNNVDETETPLTRWVDEDNVRRNFFEEEARPTVDSNENLETELRRQMSVQLPSVPAELTPLELAVKKKLHNNQVD